MTHTWLASWRRGAKKTRELRARLCVEHLEERTLLTTAPLQIVPSPSLNNSVLDVTTAIADNDIWAFGANNQATPLAEHFNGSTWSVIPTPSVAGGSFGSASAVAGNDLWAVGSQTNGNGTLIEHFNGTSWSVVSGATVPKGSFLTGVTAVASNDVWAVGDQPGSAIFNPLIEHWNGTSWSVVSGATVPNGSYLAGVSADSANDVWAVGRANGAGLVEHFDGQTWSVVPSPSIKGGFNTRGTGGLFAVTALSPTDAWAVGTRPGVPLDPIAPAIEHWNGTSWQFVAAAGSAGRGVSVAAASADDVWAIIGGGTEQWDGTSWSKIPNASGVNELDAVTALSDGTVVAVGVSTTNSAVIVSNQSSLAAAALTTAQTVTTPTGPDAASVDEIFAAAQNVEQPISSVGSSVRMHNSA